MTAEQFLIELHDDPDDGTIGRATVATREKPVEGDWMDPRSGRDKTELGWSTPVELALAPQWGLQ
jgi:hypothetical protein